MPRLVRALALPALSLVVGLAALAAGLALAGYDAGAGLAALGRGAFGSTFAFTAGTLTRAIPLILIGLGFALALRAGALNVGAEGQFYAGAVAATAVGVALPALPGPAAAPAVLAAGALAGAAWIALPVVLRVRFGVLEAISTLLLNFVAEAFVSLMVTGPLQEAQRIYPQSDPIARGAWLPFLPGTRVHAGLVVALAMAVLLHVVFARTRWGFRLLVTGAGPRAAAVSGRIDTRRAVATALLGSGALAGLAGAAEVAGVSHALYPNLSPGYGFTGIAVALLAGGRPLAIVATGVLFGALDSGAAAMQREAGIPAVAVFVAEAVIILAVLIAGALARRDARAEAPEPA